MREIVRYRAKLTVLRSSAKAQIHAVMAKHGYLPAPDDMFGPGGQVLIDEMPFEGCTPCGWSPCGTCSSCLTGS